MTSDREEVDYLFFKKYFLKTGTLLTLQQPVYVHGLSKGRACMYTCKPTIGFIHLCNFLKKENNSQADKAGSVGMEDQNPLKTQTLTETPKRQLNQLKHPKNIP
jgi:hypothetical protein